MQRAERLGQGEALVKEQTDGNEVGAMIFEGCVE